MNIRLVLGTIALAGCLAGAATAALSRTAVVTPVIAANCTVDAVTLVLDPPGRLTAIEYRSAQGGAILETTGRVLARADAASRALSPRCHRVKAVTKRELGFAGPWRPDVQSRITCVAPTPKLGIDVQLCPVLNKARRVVGNRIVIVRKNVPNPLPKRFRLVKFAAADGWVTRTGGGIRFDPSLCARNMYP
jgi:hypothetical protein